MKTTHIFQFHSISELVGFDREIYIKKGYHKKQWAIPTIMKEANDRYLIEYYVDGKTRRRLIKEFKEFWKSRAMLYKKYTVESLV